MKNLKERFVETSYLQLSVHSGLSESRSHESDMEPPVSNHTHYSELVGPARVLTERRNTQSLKFLVALQHYNREVSWTFQDFTHERSHSAILINNPFAIGHSDFGSASMLESADLRGRLVLHTVSSTATL
jgi:hypothetical protein